MKIFFSFLFTLIFTSTIVFGVPPVVKSTTVKAVPKAIILSEKYFPEDTVNRFIKNLGKDSLISLVNQRIKLSEYFIADNTFKLKNDVSLIELILIAKKYNIKLNLTEIDTASNKPVYNTYSLGNLIFGDTTTATEIFNDIRNSGISLADSFRQNVSDKMAQNLLVVFADKIIKNKREANVAFDALFLNHKAIPNNGKVYTYWHFCEINKKIIDTTLNAKEYQSKLFNELYPINNLKNFYLDTIPKTKNAELINPKELYENKPQNQELDNYNSKYDPLKMLAYSLYGKDINLNSKSDNLMYLLDAQQTNGSWSVAKKFNYFDSNIIHTIYGLWSLLSFRDLLQE